MESTEHGCYIDKYGKPVRNCKWVRWEIKAKSFTYRHPHLVLVGDDFVDIRHAPTGQFKQMVEAKNIRLLASVGIGGWEGNLFFVGGGGDNYKEVPERAVGGGVTTDSLGITKNPPPPL